MGDSLGAMGNQDFLGTEARYARAFRDYGTDLSRLAPEQGEALLGELAGEVKVEIAAALDDWAYVGWGGGFGTPNVWLFSITRLLDPDPTRDRIRDAVRGRDAPALVKLAEGLDPAVHPAQTVNLLSVYLWVVAHRPELATKLLRASQPHHPGDLQINVNLAYFLNGERRYADALPYGMAAVAVRPRSAVGWRDLAESLAGLGRDDESCAAYRRVAEISPESWTFLLKVGSELEAAGRHEAAVAEYRRAAALAEAHPATGFMVTLARRRERIDLPDEVLSGFRSRVAEQPASVAARMTLANFLYAAGRFEEALAQHRVAMRLRPDDEPARHFFGHFLKDVVKDPLAAEAEFRASIRLKPDRAETRRDLAEALRGQGRVPEAVAEYREAIRLEPGEAVFCNGLAWARLTSDARHRDPAEALEYARKAAALAPGHGGIANTLALAEYRNGNLDASLAASERSMAPRKGGDAYDWFVVALAFAKKGDIGRARASFDKAVGWTKEKAPRDAELRALWAEAAEALGLPRPDDGPAPAPGSGAGR